MARATILIVDDEPNILSSLRRALELENYHVVVAASGKQGLEKLADHDVDLALLDVSMPQMDGLELLSTIRKTRTSLPVIMMSGNASIDSAVQATKEGAFDFCEKPLGTERLLITLQNALAHAELSKEHQRLSTHAYGKRSIVGSSKVIRQVLDSIQKAAPTQGRVLVLGENGTGKELVARAIHEGSKRSKEAFIKLNCAAIPSELIESELFGHEKGAFTGATTQRRGKFELADGGTLFLDEIGDMNSNAQAKVLRVLQEGELERVGGDQTIRVNVRVVAATNQDLETAIREGRFREDLFYRLNVVPIVVPPLRDRSEDIPELVEVFLEQACELNDRKLMSIEAGGVEHLKRHTWPGNVRELRNFVERLVIFAGESSTIASEDVRRALPQSVPEGGESSYQPGTSLKEMVAEAERSLILQALTDHNHHVSNTAKTLGVERSHLYKKMKALGVNPKDAPTDG